jgi:hypothetical protein
VRLKLQGVLKSKRDVKSKYCITYVQRRILLEIKVTLKWDNAFLKNVIVIPITHEVRSIQNTFVHMKVSL